MRIQSKPTETSSVDHSTLTSIENIHKEMNKWRSEHDAWLEEIHQWQREHQIAEMVLYKMERALPDHNKALEKHAENIRQHKDLVCSCEKNMKDFLNSSEKDEEQHHALLQEHRLQEEAHQCEKNRHKSFRDTHLSTMVELIRLMRLLESDTHPRNL